MLIKSRVSKPGLATRLFQSAAGLWFPDYDLVASRRNNVLAVKRSILGEVPRIEIIPACNIVTNDGDYFYARAVYDESNIDVFDVMELGSAGTPGKAADRSDFTPIGSTEKIFDTGWQGLVSYSLLRRIAPFLRVSKLYAPIGISDGRY